jgi:hypothetical protein
MRETAQRSLSILTLTVCSNTYCATTMDSTERAPHDRLGAGRAQLLFTRSAVCGPGSALAKRAGCAGRNLQASGETGQIVIHGKGGRTRAVLLTRRVCGQLVGLRGAAGLDAPVFASRSVTSLERSRVSRIVKYACQQAGIAEDVSHRLRHTPCA